MKAVFAITRRLLACNRVSFILTAAVVVCATSSGDAQMALSNGNYTWLLAVMAPFFFVFYAYKKLLYLGASKKDYFGASLAGYGALALLISLVNTAIHALIDPLNRAQTVVNLMELCGWARNGLPAAFIQQALFLLLVMVFLHVLLLMQPRWYGWLADGILTAVICVFTPIAPLRHALAGFFRLIMFNANAPLHIAVCLLFSAVLAWAGLAVLKRATL